MAKKLVLNDVKMKLEELETTDEKAAYLDELRKMKNLPKEIIAFLAPPASPKEARGETGQFGGVTGHDVLGIPRPGAAARPEPGGITGHHLKK